MPPVLEGIIFGAGPFIAVNLAYLIWQVRKP